jgi:hypothetical protein
VPKRKVVPCVSNYPNAKNLVNFGHREGHCFEFQSLEDEKILKKLEKRQGPLASGQQRPRLCVPASARAVTPRWLSHRPPPHAGVVDHPPPPLHTQPMQLPPPRPCCTLILHSGHAETYSPPLPRWPPSSCPTLLCLSPHSSTPRAER